MAPSGGPSPQNARTNNSNGGQRLPAAEQSKENSAAKTTCKQSDAALPPAGLRLAAVAAALSEVESRALWFGRNSISSEDSAQNVIQETDLHVYQPCASFVKLLICESFGSSENPRPDLMLNRLLHATASTFLLHWLPLAVARPLLGYGWGRAEHVLLASTCSSAAPTA